MKEIPIYKEPEYPVMAKEQHEIMEQRVADDRQMKQKYTYGSPEEETRDQKYKPSYYAPHPAPGQKPIVDLQVYEASKPRPPKKQLDTSMFVPQFTTTPFYPPQWGVYNPYQSFRTPIEMPVIKNYTINVSGPMDDHAKLNAIYEDILPSKIYSNSSNSVGERLNIYTFIRSVFIKQSDGEDINLSSGGNSLVSYLKFLDLNPYNTNNFSANPYKSLPDDMLIYRSCYPIRYDKFSNSTQCATNSIGMNIRIYSLTNEEYQVRRNQIKERHMQEFDKWREIGFYEFIREKVLKTKMCPNFVMLLGYYVSENCNIDFNKLSFIRKGVMKSKETPVIQAVCKQGEKCEPIDQQTLKKNATSNLDRIPSIGAPYNGVQSQQYQNVVGNYQDVALVTNPTADSGKAIVALTESPTYNIYGWATRTYQVEGNYRRMINTGFHLPEEWMSIIFQIAVVMYIFELYNIVFPTISIEDNFYIKDLTTQPNVTTYWKYVIDGVEYYIPNYGYLLLFDSNFKDINIESTIGTVDHNKMFKIYSTIYTQGVQPDYSNLSQLTVDSFRRVMNRNNFSRAFTNNGGSQPPEEVLKFLDSVQNDKMSRTVGEYIKNCFSRFLNNRVGTLLRENEIKNVRRDDKPDFKTGQMIVQEVSHEAYVFVTYLEDDASGQCRVVTRNDPLKMNSDIIQKSVPKGTLRPYTLYEPITQNQEPNKTIFSEENLLEVYTIDKKSL